MTACLMDSGEAASENASHFELPGLLNLSFGEEFRTGGEKKTTGNTISPCTHVFNGQMTGEGILPTTKTTHLAPFRGGGGVQGRGQASQMLAV